MNHTLLIALLLVGSIAATVALLIFVTRRQARARKAALRSAYRALLSEHGITTDVVEEFPHRILGLDSAQHVFAAVQDGLPPGVAIRLCDVAGYGVTTRAPGRKSTGKIGKPHPEEQIEAISLLFMLRDGSKVEFPVYTEILDGIAERMRLHAVADGWRKRLEGAFRSREQGSLPAMQVPVQAGKDCKAELSHDVRESEK